MKKYNIVLKEAFHYDLNYIQDIIFRFTFSKETVKKIIDSIYIHIYSLSILPYRYVSYKNFRVITIRKKYKVFYKINETK